MESDRREEKTLLKNVLDGFIDSYTGRNENIEFSGWLADRIRQEVPAMTEEAGNKLAGEIIEAVIDYDRTLAELNAAIGVGESSEEWFAGRMEKAYANMLPAETGEKLKEIENDYTASNTELIRRIDGTLVSGADTVDDENIEWNRYSIKDKTYKIVKQIALSGAAVAANVVKEKVENQEDADIGSVAQETFQEGLKQNPVEIKAVVAGAVKVAAVKGLEDRLPEDMPVGTICDMAGAAVESAEALFDAVNGDCTAAEALDKVGRAIITAGGRCCADVLEGTLSKLPGGGVLIEISNGLMDHLRSPKFVENMSKIGKDIYVAVRDVAVDTWNGLKKSVGKVAGKVKNVLFG